MWKDGAGRCGALQGELRRNCSCAIYGQRPEVCREFEAGSEECLEARERAWAKTGNAAG